MFCECCNYKAKCQSEFNKHLKSQKHARKGVKKDYKCESCDYFATTHWNLKMHVVLKHYDLEQKKTLKYYCELCDNVNFSNLYYQNHLKSTLHKNNTIISNQQKGIVTDIQIYKRKKQNKTDSIELVGNINTETNLENKLKIYMKELIDEMKNEIIQEIKQNKTL